MRIGQAQGLLPLVRQPRRQRWCRSSSLINRSLAVKAILRRFPTPCFVWLDEILQDRCWRRAYHTGCVPRWQALFSRLARKSTHPRPSTSPNGANVRTKKPGVLAQISRANRDDWGREFPTSRARNSPQRNANGAHQARRDPRGEISREFSPAAPPRIDRPRD